MTTSYIRSFDEEKNLEIDEVQTRNPMSWTSRKILNTPVTKRRKTIPRKCHKY